MAETCQFCGDDDGVICLCLDCLEASGNGSADAGEMGAPDGR